MQARFPDSRLRRVARAAFPVSCFETSDHAHLWRATQSPVHSGGNRAGFTPGFPCRPRLSRIDESAWVTPATVNPCALARDGLRKSVRELNSDTNITVTKIKVRASCAPANLRAACCCSSPSLLDYTQRGQTTYHPAHTRSSGRARESRESARAMAAARRSRPRTRCAR
jgi:hypothetical protein